jgi:hypothetical protein
MWKRWGVMAEGRGAGLRGQGVAGFIMFLCQRGIMPHPTSLCLASWRA